MRDRNAEPDGRAQCRAPEDKRILYRIGVHLGDVLIEGDDILGEGVNIAARLEGICDPGGVLFSGSAHDMCAAVSSHLRRSRREDLKNISRPVRVYALEPAQVAPRAPRARAE